MDPRMSQKPKGPGSITRTIRIESTPGAGQVHTMLWLGDTHIRASPAQIQAAARVAAGLELADGDIDLLRALDLIATPPSEPVPDRVALVSGAATLIRLKPAEVRFGEVRGPTKRTVTPRELSLEWFIPPSTLGPLLRLEHQVMAGWSALQSEARVNGTAIDAERVTQVLQTQIRSMVSADFSMQAAFEIDDSRGFKLVPTGPFAQAKPQYDFAGAWITHDRDPSKSQSRPRANFAPGGPDALHELSLLLGMVSEGAGSNDLRKRFAASPVCRAALLELMSKHLLNETTPASLALQPGQIMSLAGRALVVDLGGATVLIDPHFIAGSRTDTVPPPRLRDLPHIDAVLLTDSGAAAADLHTWLNLPTRLPVYLPQAPVTTGTHDVARTLRALGFDRLRLIKPNTATELGASTLTGLGVGQPGAIAWHLALPGHTALVMGRSGALPSPLPAQTLFATRRRDAVLRLDQGWPALFRNSEDWCDVVQAADGTPQKLQALVAAAGANRLVLYDEGGADWHPEQHLDNHPARLRWSSADQVAEIVGASVRSIAPTEVISVAP